MNDQAERLRELYKGHPQQNRHSGSVQTIGVTSGKGGMGKTNISLNLGIALSKRDKKVLLMDADLNLGNIDALLGLTPEFTLRNVISGQRQINDIIIEAPGGIHLIPSTSGALELSGISSRVRRKIIEEVAQVALDYDYLLIDTPAGIGAHVSDFLEGVNSVFIVTSPEPTAIIDAYAMFKLLWSFYPGLEIELLINLAKSKEEAVEVFEKLNLVTEKYLDRQILKFNFIEYDESVSKSVREQSPFILSASGSKASICLNRLANQIIKTNKVDDASEGFKGFVPGFVKTVNVPSTLQ
jgi:flagellar biosynthesis protein FlhG